MACSLAVFDSFQYVKDRTVTLPDKTVVPILAIGHCGGSCNNALLWNNRFGHLSNKFLRIFHSCVQGF